MSTPYSPHGKMPTLEEKLNEIERNIRRDRFTSCSQIEAYDLRGVSDERLLKRVAKLRKICRYRGFRFWWAVNQRFVVMVVVPLAIVGISVLALT